MPATTYSSHPCGAGIPAREEPANIADVGSSQCSADLDGFVPESESRVEPKRGQECPRHTGDTAADRNVQATQAIQPRTGMSKPQTGMLATSNYRYRRRLPHLQKADAPIFVTFRKGTREPLPDSCRTAVLKRCLYGNGSRFQLHAGVVMPEHVHLLMTPLRNEAGDVYWLADILKGIKGASARDVNRIVGSSGPVWEEESFDHIIRSDEILEEKIEYIRRNPVRRELVKSPEEYQWLWVQE